MKKLIIQINKKLLFAISCATVLLFSCSKWDDYKKYTKDGEITYVGALDSVKILSGKNRMQIQGKFNADPNITAVKIFWNQNKDSLVIPVKRVVGDNLFSQIFPMPEGVTSFKVYTYDAQGNKSVGVDVTGKSFGDNFRKIISNRLLTNIRHMSGNTIISWEPVDLLSGVYTTEVLYAVNGQMKTATSAGNAPTILDALDNTNTLIRYRNIIKPDATSIDTFMVPFKDTIVVPLKNSKLPFEASAKSGNNTWGNLTSWQSNNAIKNHGGFGPWNTGDLFNVETNATEPITNGKVWQAFTLDAGTYTFAISDLASTNLTNADNVYLVVAAGDGLPDVANIATAINSIKIGGTSAANLKVKFTLTQRSQVSVGYLATQAVTPVTPPATPVTKTTKIRAFNVYLDKP
jgi:hypothetical protein